MAAVEPVSGNPAFTARVVLEFRVPMMTDAFNSAKRWFFQWRRKYRILFWLCSLLGIVIGLFRGGSFLLDRYTTSRVGFTVTLADSLEPTSVLLAIEHEINERLKSATLEIPLVVQNISPKKVQLSAAAASIDAIFLRYFAGDERSEFQEWFRYRLVFDPGPARFKASTGNDTTARPTLDAHDYFRGVLLLGGLEGNFPNLLVGPSETRIVEYIQKRQGQLSATILREEHILEQAMEERLKQTAEDARRYGLGFSGWFKSAQTEARERMKDEMLLYCKIDGERSVVVGDARWFFVQPLASEDLDLLEFSINVELTDTIGRTNQATARFVSQCNVSEELYQWMSFYPVKSVGYGKEGTRTRWLD